jgi:hypothetical protein
MDAQLVVVSGTTKGREVTLRLPAVVGRGRDASLMLPHPLISRRHCEIFESDGYLVVRDMGSLNGTFVNNERINEAVLPPGGLLTLGSITLQAVYTVSPGREPPAVAASGKAASHRPPAAAAPAVATGPQGDAEEPVEFESVDEAQEKAGPEPEPEQPPAKKPPKKPVRPAPKPAAPPESFDDDMADFLSDFK